MKTLHVTIIISVIVVSVIAISIGIIQLQYDQKQITYQYEIHEPYNLTDGYFKTATMQNKTFFIDNISKTLNTTNSTEMEWYGIKFSFPHGSEFMNTPGGGIFESYMTFPDDPVPYRIAIGQSSYPGSTHYDFTTVLSTHTDPQAGFTLHNGTIWLLVNWSKIHSDLAILGLNDTYKTDQPIDFQVEASGFGYFNGGQTPKLWIERQDGGLTWSPIEKIGIVLCCPPELEQYDRIFNFTLGGPTTISKPGQYSLVVSYDDKIIRKQFSVILPNNTPLFDTGITHMSANVTNTNFTVNYNIEGAKVLGIKQDKQSKAVILFIQTTTDGQLTIDLPRELIYSKTYTNMDDSFIVLADGQEIRVKEIHKNIAYRTLLIPFQNGTSKIEIIGTSII